MCYGHRIHTQYLDANLSVNAACKCKHLHGHNATIIVTLCGSTLDKRGVIVDFNELNWFKKFIDDNLDHKFIIDRNDPLLDHLAPNGEVAIASPNPVGVCKLFVRPGITLTDAVREMYEGIVIVDFVPTSENLSAWLFKVIQEKLNPLNITVHSVQFFETPKSQSTYTTATC